MLLTAKHPMQRTCILALMIILTACNDKPEFVVQDPDFAVFPNPAINELNIQISNPQNSHYHVLVIDPKGNVLLEKNESFEEGFYQVFLQNEPEGTYHVVLEKDNTTIVKKVVKIEQ